LHIKSNLSTAYHPEMDGQTEHVNQILEQYLWLYVNYQQDNWNSLLPLAEFAYNNTPHSATSVTPFFANKGYNPKLDISMDSVPSSAAAQIATDLSELHTFLRERLRETITQYSAATQNRRNPIPPFEVGQLVWLDARHIRTVRPSKKLDHKRIGPFPIIEKVSTHARRLALPLALRSIHNVFHVSLLESHTSNPFPNRIPSPPPPIEVAGETEFEVEEIVDSKVDRRRNPPLLYLVRWKGYGGTPEEFSWEPPRNLDHATEAIAEFHRAYPDKPRP
jgi:hypothetical protein